MAVVEFKACYDWILQVAGKGILEARRPFRASLPGDSYVVPFWVVHYNPPEANRS